MVDDERLADFYAEARAVSEDVQRLLSMLESVLMMIKDIDGRLSKLEREHDRT